MFLLLNIIKLVDSCKRVQLPDIGQEQLRGVQICTVYNIMAASVINFAHSNFQPSDVRTFLPNISFAPTFTENNTQVIIARTKHFEKWQTTMPRSRVM